MSSALCHVPPAFVQGEVRLVESFDLSAQLADAERLGLLPASPTAPGPAERGRLALLIEEAIETALEHRGACPPGVRAASSIEASLKDQLYRARLLEFSGVALAIPSLAGIADSGGALDAEDSAVLRWWVLAANRVPLRILLDYENRNLGVYGPPCALVEWLSTGVWMRDRSEPPPALAPAVAESSAAMELSEPPPAVIEHDGALAFQQPLEAESAEIVVESRESLAESATLPDVAAEGSVVGTAESGRGASTRHIADITDAILQSLVDKTDAVIHVPQLFPNAAEQWRTWADELDRARGAKPLSAIERMFVSSYVPLRHALGQGLADKDALRVVERWSSSFADSYSEAFDALRIRGKRPSMVLDVPDIALRIGRLHGARSVQLLLVDGMRFDLGLRVEQRVRALVGQQAALTERLLLWSALPSTTEVQLELVGRGPEGLRGEAPAPDFEVPVARGRAAATLRRVKTGHRELLKLDLVEARLIDPGAPEPARLDAIADETARAVAEHLQKQAPRTLVFAFGDHGFVLDAQGAGTARARQGGSSPEEVLVPGFAWLVGGLH